MHLRSKVLSVREYGTPQSLKLLSVDAGISEQLLTDLLLNASQKVKDKLGISDCIVFSGKAFQIAKIAGILKLSQNIELEIVPKFLLQHSINWKEDFYFIASLNIYGIHLSDEALGSNLNSHSSSLIDTLGEIMVKKYLALRRNPIRTYEKLIWRDFVINGDIDGSEYYECDDDGFLQSEMQLSYNNVYNQAFFKAFNILLVEVRSPILKIKIKNCLAKLTPQRGGNTSFFKRLPSRYKKWEQIYSLAIAVLKSFNLSYSPSNNKLLPGFIIRTADAWENLMFDSLKTNFTKYKINRDRCFLGMHSKPSVTINPLFVSPDISVIENLDHKLLLDSKYKSIFIDRESSISRSDIYEMLAFLRSTKAKKGLLLYPAQDGIFDDNNFPGQTFAFERVIVEDLEIIGVCVNLSGISKKNGYEIFCKNIQANILSYIF